jgi:hypothetical protein
MTLWPEGENEQENRPVTVEGLEGVHVRRVYAGQCSISNEAYNAFAIGEAGELFSWGFGENKCLGRSDEGERSSPKRVEALRGVRVSCVSIGDNHALALTEDGQVYWWGVNNRLSPPFVLIAQVPMPVEVLRGMRVGSIAAGGHRSYAVTDTGELWAWGWDDRAFTPIGHGERMNCLLPKPIESLRGIKVVAVVAGFSHTLALAEDGSVYAWDHYDAVSPGALGLSRAVHDAGEPVCSRRSASLRCVWRVGCDRMQASEGVSPRGGTSWSAAAVGVLRMGHKTTAGGWENGLSY